MRLNYIWRGPYFLSSPPSSQAKLAVFAPGAAPNTHHFPHRLPRVPFTGLTSSMADPVADALRAIYATNLTPYEHKILALDFVKGAFEPPLAAAEILRAVSEARAADVPVVEALLTLKREWHDLLILGEDGDSSCNRAQVD